MKPLRILTACESSGRVRDAFIRLGHDAISCDILPTEQPGPHHQGDVLEFLPTREWDMMIAFPPCTYLSASGMHWTARGMRDPKLTEDALDFVRRLMAAPIRMKAIENPVGIISTRIRRPDQIIQPHEHGHDASKKTCLWLENLPKIKPTTMVPGRRVCCGVTLYPTQPHCPLCGGTKRPLLRWGNQQDSGQNNLPDSKGRDKERSRTYPGIAAAFASQWG